MELARIFALAILFFAVSVAATPSGPSYAFPNGPCGKMALAASCSQTVNSAGAFLH